MFDAIAKFSVDDDVDEEKSLLLHAHLACLLDGLDAGHIDEDAFNALRSALKDNLQGAGLVDTSGNATGARVRAEPMWNLFIDAVTTAAHTLHPSGRPVALADTRTSDPDFCGLPLVTIGRLEFHTEMVRRGASDLGRTSLEKVSRVDIIRLADDRAALTDIVECCNYAIWRGRMTLLDYYKGDPEGVAWMTPVEARTQVLLDRADKYGLRKADISELRDLLGLWAENGKAKRPLAAFFLYCAAGLAAPNLFTAQGYERFRHRPLETIPDSPNSGLTYNMDRESSGRHPGACEIVSNGIALSQVTRIEAGGQPKRFRAGRAAELESHRQYSEDVHRGRPINDILVRLDAIA